MEAAGLEEEIRKLTIVESAEKIPEKTIVVLSNRIQVSSSKKPVRFYVNLAKVSPNRLLCSTGSLAPPFLFLFFLIKPRYCNYVSWCLVSQKIMNQHNEVVLSALGKGTSVALIFFTLALF